MRALGPCQHWAAESDIWISAPCPVLSVSGITSLGIIRRVNTDYRHGDCPAGSFWCDAQMKTGDHEHPLVGRIRVWDALIILFRHPVSLQPLISHLRFPPPPFLVVSDPVSFIFIFVFYFILFVSR